MDEKDILKPQDSDLPLEKKQRPNGTMEGDKVGFSSISDILFLI